MFGTAGLPHILMRFFTVPNAKEARKSVFFATGFIGFFYILTFIIGFGAIALVWTTRNWWTPPSSPPPRRRSTRSWRRRAPEHGRAAAGQGGGRTIAVPGFISAVAFATILAVVVGSDAGRGLGHLPRPLCTVVRKGKANEQEEIMVSKIATLCLGIFAIVLGIYCSRSSMSRSRRSRLRHRLVVQLPGAADVDVLERHDDAGRGRRWLPRPDHRGARRRALAGGGEGIFGNPRVRRW